MPLVFGVVLLAVCLAAIGWTWLHFHARGAVSSVPASTSNSTQPTTLDELLALPPAKLEQCDIALIDLICAKGLRGSEHLDIPACLKTLDNWTEAVKTETQRHEYRFRDHPEDYKNSLGRFQMNMMGTVLAQDLGIHYDPDFLAAQTSGNPITNGWEVDSQLSFIHGLLMSKHVGTCASMPVLYVAIGRRLGYPVSLCSSKNHGYVQYDEPHGEHFNVEATTTIGFLTPTDDDYKTDMFTCTEEEIRQYGWLRPLNNAGILYQCLMHRAISLANMKQYAEAKKVWVQVARYGPDTPMVRSNTALALEQLALAPVGDEINDLHEAVKSLSVPEGTLNAYFENRKLQVCCFITDNTNSAAIEQAAADLRKELAQYRKELASDPAHPRYEAAPNILALTDKSGKKTVRIPAAALPPPLNCGEIPPGYLKVLDMPDLDDDGLVVDKLWMHYKASNPHWMTEVAGLIRPPPPSPAFHF